MKILLVEDDKRLCSLLLTVLAKFGHEPVVAATGRLGLDLLEVYPDIGLILLDWALPGMSGIEVLDALRARGKPYPPVIMLTARKRREDVVTALRKGATDYMAKPVSLRHLIQKIQKLGNREGEASAPPAAGEPPRVEMEASCEFNLADISETGCCLLSSFPVPRDAILFLESEDLARRLEMPEDEELAVRVANCQRCGSRFRIGAQFVYLPSEVSEQLRRLCRN